MEKVLTVEDIKKKGTDGKYRAVCASGNTYEVRYFTMCGGVFFSDVPYGEEIIGYKPSEN